MGNTSVGVAVTVTVTVTVTEASRSGPARRENHERGNGTVFVVPLESVC